MKRILVTGARGYLASLARLYNAEPSSLCISHTDVDFRDPAGVEDFFRAADFDVCLHMAADATTAHCEQDPEGTHRVNTESAIAIARACRDRGKRVVFISTEQCFNASPGEAPFPRRTSRRPPPATASRRWRPTPGSARTSRTTSSCASPGCLASMPGVHPSPNILTNVMRVLRTGEPAGFRVHERRNMTYAQRFAGQLPQILELPSGAYHFASQNGRTTYETARLVAERLGCPETEVDRLILPDEVTYADAPRDFRLASDKIRAVGIELGTFEEDLDLCLRDFGLL